MIDPVKKPKPTHYKVVCISLYTRDIAALDAKVDELKRQGWSKANRSELIRIALDSLDIDRALACLETRRAVHTASPIAPEVTDAGA